MKVYILEHQPPYDPGSIYGVFLTLPAAEHALNRFRRRMGEQSSLDLVISCYDVEDAPEGYDA